MIHEDVKQHKNNIKSRKSNNKSVNSWTSGS